MASFRDRIASKRQVQPSLDTNCKARTACRPAFWSCFAFGSPFFTNRKVIIGIFEHLDGHAVSLEDKLSDFSVISNELDLIERGEGVKILFACESGSRAWGFSSPDSDFDVRFVYMRPISDYLRLDRPRDTIEYRIEADNFDLGVEFDASGWDLDKFLRLLRASNPSAVEWLGAKTVYREDSRFWKVKWLRDKCFDPVSGAWHYYGLAKNHDSRYLKDEALLAKRYLYLVRAILAAKWCVRHFEPVPEDFGDLCKAILPPELMTAVDSLLETKRNSAEKQEVERIPALDDWISANMDSLPDVIRRYRHHEKLDWDVFDRRFLELIGF